MKDNIKSEKGKLISLIVPVYNTETYLRRCLDSLVLQDYPDIEVIMVDDGSTDHSNDIINEYVRQHSNFFCISQSNKGVGAARNAGMLKAKGDYISFVDSDDLIMPDYCSYLLHIIGDADIAIAGRENYKDDVYIKSKTPSHLMTVEAIDAIRYMMIGKFNTRPAWGKLYKREITETISFVEDHIFEEIRFSAECFARSGKVILADRDLYSYRVRPGSIMTTDEEEKIKELALALEYVYQILIREHIYSECEAELKIWIARVIVHNTRYFCRKNINIELFKEYSGRLVELYDELGGLGDLLQRKFLKLQENP